MIFEFPDPNYEIVKKLVRDNPKAYELSIFWNELLTSSLIVTKNYEQLSSLQKMLNDPRNFLELTRFENWRKLEKLKIETSRLLHNYLASIYMYSQTVPRLIGKRLGKQGLFFEYREERDRRFSNNPIADFEKGLRNFSTHRSLPIVYPSFDMENVNQEGIRSHTGFSLDIKKLLKYRSWFEYGKTYIQMWQHLGHIRILDFVESYQKLFKELEDWLTKKLNEKYSEEFSFLSRIYKLG